MISTTFRLAAVGALATLVSGCVEETTTTSRMPNAAEQACLAVVARETNNGDVMLSGSEFSQAGTLVRVTVGEYRAPWTCIAYSDGSTGEITFRGTDGGN